MKKISFLFSLLALAGIFFITSCEDNEGIITPVDPDAEFDVELEVDEADAANSQNVSFTVDPDVQSTVSAKVQFTADGSQRRMYITRNIAGTGEEPFDLGELNVSVDDKGDGSIDIEASGKDTVTYSLNLPIPDSITVGTIVYKFWTTSAKGDFRLDTKNLVTGPSTITLTYGSGANSDAAVKEYTGVRLYAPDSDSKSSTFFSLLDGEVYLIEGAPEFSSIWDFGYFYTNNASLASISSYEDSFGSNDDGPFVDVDALAGTTDLNDFFMSAVNTTSLVYDDIALSKDLDGISTPSGQLVENLEVGDVIEFVDQYENKGLIKITAIEEGFALDDYIEFDVKVQP